MRRFVGFVVNAALLKGAISSQIVLVRIYEVVDRTKVELYMQKVWKPDEI